MEDKVFISPNRYVQGRGVLSHLADYTSPYGDICLVIGSASGLARYAGLIEKSREDAPQQTFFEEAFSGECEMGDIMRLVERAKELKADLILGLGGGKALDTAKAVAHFADLPAIVAPTAASSDAPCSALSVVYKPDGSLDQLLLLRHNPDVVLVDNDVIVTGPPRLLAAGIGDALATYFEMKACWDTDAHNFLGKRITLAAKAIASECHEVLAANAVKAYMAASQHVCTPAVEAVIEANILLSGIGFESGGTCAAHPINNGLAECERTHAYYHGEKVAFSIIAMQLLLDYPEDEIWETMALLHDVGLPVTLEELGFEGGITAEELDLAAGIADADPTIHRIPKQVDAGLIRGCIVAADAMGRAFLAEQ